MADLCQRAKDLAAQLDADPRVGPLIEACCGQSDAEPCARQLARLAADAACKAKTGNACPPCCEYVSGVVADFAVDLLYETGVGGVLEDFWDLGGAIVDSVIGVGPCDFDPLVDAALHNAEKNLRGQAAALRAAWIGAHERLGLNLPSYSFAGHLAPVVWSYGWPKLRGYQEPHDALMSWPDLLTRRAARQRLRAKTRYGDYINIADSSYGAMWMPQVQLSTTTPNDYLRVQFKHWSCEREEQFKTALARAITIRMQGVDIARQKLTAEIAEWMARNQQTPLQRLRLRPTPRRRTGLWIAGGSVAAGCGIVGAAATFLRR